MKHKLNLMRDLSMQSDKLRALLREISTLLVYESLRELPLVERAVLTRADERKFKFVDETAVVFVPILRAGIPMLDGALTVLPRAGVGFLALKRNEETLEAELYYSRLPNLQGKKVLILDPMLATGGTLLKAIEEVMKFFPAETFSIHILCAPEGISKVEKAFPMHTVITAGVDEGLDSRGFIVPGLGDVGDRLFSETEH